MAFFYEFNFGFMMMPAKEDTAVIRKKSRPTAIPDSIEVFMIFSPYRKTNSRAPAPPMVTGMTEAMDEIIKRNR
jgi:hypothetical protein